MDAVGVVHHTSDWRLLIEPRQSARSTVDALPQFSSDLDLDLDPLGRDSRGALRTISAQAAISRK